MIIHEFRSADQKNEERAETDAGTDGERGTDMNKIDSNNETDFLTGNNMTEKLIRDGKESRRAKWNLLSVSVGAVLLLMGVICVLMKALTGTDIDENGLLQENFFLLPAALLFFFGGFITFLVTGIHNVIEWGISKGSTDRQSLKKYSMISAGVLCLCAGTFLVLLESNSGIHTAAAGAIIFLTGLADIAATVMWAKRKNSPEET